MTMTTTATTSRAGIDPIRDRTLAKIHPHPPAISREIANRTTHSTRAMRITLKADRHEMLGIPTRSRWMFCQCHQNQEPALSMIAQATPSTTLPVRRAGGDGVGQPVRRTTARHASRARPPTP